MGGICDNYSHPHCVVLFFINVTTAISNNKHTQLLLPNRYFSGEKTFKTILKEKDFSPGFARLVFI